MTSYPKTGEIRIVLHANLVFADVKTTDISSPTSDKDTLKTALDAVKAAQMTSSKRTTKISLLASLSISIMSKPHRSRKYSTQLTANRPPSRDMLKLNRNHSKIALESPANNVAGDLGSHQSLTLRALLIHARPFNPGDLWTPISVSFAESYDAEQSGSSTNGW
jgi:hypothetical protein